MLLITLLACGQDVALLPAQQHTYVTVDSFIQPVLNPKLDILVVLDGSCSMEDNELQVGQGMVSIDNEANTIAQSYNFIFTTATEGATGFLGPYTSSQTNDILAAPSHLPSIEYGEAGFGALYYHLQDPNFPIRLDADTLVFFISDEDDQSSPVFTVDHIAQYLATYKPNQAMDVISIVATDSTHCGEIGTRYIQLAGQFGNSPIDICSHNWSRGLGHSSYLTNQQGFIVLTRIPIVDSIVVYINHEVNTDWTYRPDNYTVYFTDPPPQGSLVEVGYEVLVQGP